MREMMTRRCCFSPSTWPATVSIDGRLRYTRQVCKFPFPLLLLPFPGDDASSFSRPRGSHSLTYGPWYTQRYVNFPFRSSYRCFPAMTRRHPPVHVAGHSLAGTLRYSRRYVNSLSAPHTAVPGNAASSSSCPRVQPQFDRQR